MRGDQIKVRYCRGFLRASECPGLGWAGRGVGAVVTALGTFAVWLGRGPSGLALCAAWGPIACTEAMGFYAGGMGTCWSRGEMCLRQAPGVRGAWSRDPQVKRISWLSGFASLIWLTAWDEALASRAGTGAHGGCFRATTGTHVSVVQEEHTNSSQADRLKV